MSDIDTAMVLAAGFGTRMRPLTETTPKPLIKLLGKPLIDWSMERLRAGGVTRFVVNTHYLAHQLEAHFADAGDVTIIHEPDILETGGGVKNALHLLGDKPFFAVNTDAIWLEGPYPALGRLRRNWRPEAMDAMLLLQPTVRAFDYYGSGDYRLDPDGRAERRGEGEVVPYVFSGVQILHPRLFENAPDGAFSLNRIYDEAQVNGRLYGLPHDGEWYHVGTPEALAQAEAIIAHGQTKSNTR